MLFPRPFLQPRSREAVLASSFGPRAASVAGSGSVVKKFGGGEEEDGRARGGQRDGARRASAGRGRGGAREDVWERARASGLIGACVRVVMSFDSFAWSAGRLEERRCRRRRRVARTKGGGGRFSPRDAAIAAAPPEEHSMKRNVGGRGKDRSFLFPPPFGENIRGSRGIKRRPLPPKKRGKDKTHHALLFPSPRFLPKTKREKKHKITGASPTPSPPT